MRKSYALAFSICAICSTLFNAVKAHERAVTYETPGGRLGDQLIAYMHAKWISYVHEIPLLYKPFPYSKDLALDEREEIYLPTHPQSFQRIIHVENLSIIEENAFSNVLFITPYFPESSYELKLANWSYFPVNWKDPLFISLLRTLICPKYPITQPELPTDKITVAVHVRRGGGFDDPAVQRHWPLKFPPDSFYIAQIRKIYEMLQKPLFVHIFTDDASPNLIVDSYAKSLSDIDVTFDFRSQGNSYKANVLDDLFDMMRYNCLIRPESNYSIVAEKIGECKIVIHPLQCILNEKQIVVTETNLIIKD